MLKFVEPENSETTLQMLSGKFYVNVCVESANVAVEQAIKSDQENELIEQNTQFFVYYMKLWNLEKQANYILIYTHKKRKHNMALHIVLLNKHSSI